MIISIVCDNQESWIWPYVRKLSKYLRANGHKVHIISAPQRIPRGDICVLLSCESIVPAIVLRRNKNNLVVHESYLPKGKGWSPLTWQILKGKRQIPITLIEATQKVDSGVIYDQEIMEFQGHELVGELRQKQGEATLRLISRFVEIYPNNRGRSQVGKSTYYPRRHPMDSELNVHKTIAEQFNLLRIVDNERYPAFLKYRKHTFALHIEKAEM